MAVNQCTRFNACPMLCHEKGKGVTRIARYLLSSQDKGIHYKPASTRGFFASGWSSGDVHNPECVLSHTGYLLMYAGCPINIRGLASCKLKSRLVLLRLST